MLRYRPEVLNRYDSRHADGRLGWRLSGSLSDDSHRHALGVRAARGGPLRAAAPASTTRQPPSRSEHLRTRGKRVVAEVTIPAALIEEHMHTTSGKLFRARQVARLGGFMSGPSGFPTAITALRSCCRH